MNELFAVNMNRYKFGSAQYKGFGIFDERTFSFVSIDGKNPYVVAQKKTLTHLINTNQACSFTKRAGANFELVTRTA